MDIIKTCADQPNIRARTLLRSRGLNEFSLNHFLILASARLIRTYITLRSAQENSDADAPDMDAVLREMNIPSLAERIHLDLAFTTLVVREMAPAVIQQLRSSLEHDHSLLSLFDNHDAA